MKTDDTRVRRFNYHPFYITSNNMGGYGKKVNKAARKQERIYAGVDHPYQEFQAKPTVQGDFCRWTSKDGEDKWRESETFDQYKKTLEIVCQKRKGHSSAKARYGVLNWTVQDNTEDIVYYQSYTHEGMG